MIDRKRVDSRLDSGMDDGLDLDVAIVGGGVGGLYTGYRLRTGHAEGDAPRNVGIFELSDRIGGRLHSVRLPGMEIYGELGGMRYLTSMAIVTSLIEGVFKDELKHVEFSMGDPATHFFYLRKQRFRADAWTNAQKNGQKFITRYALDDDEVGLSPDQAYNKVIHDVLVADPWVRAKFGEKIKFTPPYDYEFKLTARDWDAIKPRLTYCFPGPYEGRPVNDLGMWNVYEDRASQEGLQFVADAGGYYSNTINWNAGEGFQLMVGDFSGPMISYRTIEGGYDQVAYALAKALLDELDTPIYHRNGVVSVAPAPHDSRRRYELIVANQDSGTQWRVHADAVVLAMPRRSLELLDRGGRRLSLFDGPEGGAFRRHVDSTIIQPSMKIMMAFEEPWWKQDFGALAGESITDLPMRQCYYFGTDPDDSHSLFLASYNDMDTVSFWRALQHEDLFVPRATALAGDAELDEIAHLQAPEVMVAEAMSQVRELHGTLKQPIPDPYATLYMDWEREPFGGGYHAWKAGISVPDTMRYMRRPRAEEAIHVCGEAYSDQQGWVEGALCTAERMLQEHFGLPWPEFVPSDYYLGW